MQNKYITSFAKFEELENVVDFGYKMVGSNHIDLKTLQRRHLINSEIVVCLFERLGDNKKGKIIGYYILYPLNKEAYESIENFKIINGRGLTDDCFSSSFLNAFGLYIGMLGAVGFQNTGYVLKELLYQIEVLIDTGNLKAIYTRGATKSGKRVVSGFDFKSLGGQSEISAVLINNKNIESNRFKRHSKNNI